MPKAKHMIHKLGQYFTTNLELKDVVLKFISNEPDNILEPSIGQGDLISHVMKHKPAITFDMYEIDVNIKMLNNIEHNKIIFGDFMIQKIDKLYRTIIGNPPTLFEAHKVSLEEGWGRDSIYVYNLTRRENIAFVGNVGYFGGSLIMLISKKDCDLNKIVDYLNTEQFRNNFIFSGRFKMGHRQLSNSYIDSSYI